MGALAQSSLTIANAACEDLGILRSRDRSAGEAQRRKWWKLIGRAARSERPERPDPRGEYFSLFILGYGLVPGVQEKPRDRF